MAAHALSSDTRSFAGTYPAVGQILVAILAALVTALVDGKLDLADLLTAAVIGLGAIAVWLVPLLDVRWGTLTKAATSFLVAGLALLVSFVSDGFVSPLEWLQVALAAFAAIGIGVGPVKLNASQSTIK